MRDPRFRTMTEDDAAEISAWRYPPPYDFYDPGADDDDLNELLDPVRREAEYSTAVDESGAIIGFAQLTRDGDSVEIGLGLRPDLTGRGLGGDFVEAVVQLARDRHAPGRITLAVAEFNRRAITVYERAGFVAVRRYRHHTNGREWDFLAMELDEPVPGTAFQEKVPGDRAAGQAPCPRGSGTAGA